MQQYLDFLRVIRDNGVDKPDRTGVGIRSYFGLDMRFDLSQGFPLVTTKKMHVKSIIHELLWFLQGNTNIQYLNDNGVTIWDEWADEHGDLGPVYGHQWRSWPGKDGKTIDQISQVMNQIQSAPHSRRLIVSAWNVAQLDEMALPPCHLLFQFYVANGRLSCKLTQRSADAFLGVPFNIASYSLLIHMMSEQCGLLPGEFIWSGGDCHIYHNHLDQVDEQLSRSPKSLPELVMNRDRRSLFDYEFADFSFENYQCWPAIKAPIAV